MFYRTAHFHRLSLSDTERDCTREQKAKDWDVLEKICKIHPVGTPKVHLWKLAHGGGAIYDEEILIVLVAVAPLLDAYGP